MDKMQFCAHTELAVIPFKILHIIIQLLCSALAILTFKKYIFMILHHRIIGSRYFEGMWCLSKSLTWHNIIQEQSPQAHYHEYLNISAL